MAKKSTKKKTTKKKASSKKKASKRSSSKSTKKKTTKKKSTRKKRSKKKPTAVNLPRVIEDEQPPPDDVELQVWESYRRLRSRVLVARELDISERQVRNVLEADSSRVRRMLDDYAEYMVAEREAAERLGLDMLYRSMGVYDRWLRRIEIAEAEALEKGQKDGVAMVESPDGGLMTVMQAVEYITTSRAFMQLVEGITKLRRDIDKYRDPQVGKAAVEEDAKRDDAMDNFSDMDPAQLAEILEQGGAPLPGVLGRLRKHVQNTARPTS